MPLVERVTRDGLLVAEHGMDARSIQAALKQIDDRFQLWPPDGMSEYWRVYCRINDWTEAPCVATWMDDFGNPLPLSSGLIDKVNRLRMDSPNQGVSVDEHNAKHVQRVRDDREQRDHAIAQEHAPKLERARTSVSFGPLAKLGEHPTPIRRKKG